MMTRPEIRRLFAKNLRQCLAEKGMSQRELAVILHEEGLMGDNLQVCINHVHRHYHAQRNPTAFYVAAFARALGVSADRLLFPACQPAEDFASVA